MNDFKDLWKRYRANPTGRTWNALSELIPERFNPLRIKRLADGNQMPDNENFKPIIVWLELQGIATKKSTAEERQDYVPTVWVAPTD